MLLLKKSLYMNRLAIHIASYETVLFFSNKQCYIEKQENAKPIIGYRKSIILEESQLILIFPTETTFPEITSMEFLAAYIGGVACSQFSKVMI